MKFIENGWFWVFKTLDIRYIFQFGISFLKYRFAHLVVRFDDYLDYLEISRFKMWHFVTSFESSDEKEAAFFSGKVNSAFNFFNVRPFFSKVGLEAENFPGIRGFTWDRGDDADSLERRLILGEYYLSYEKDIPFNNFQTYMLDNRSLYYQFRRTEYDHESYIPGLTYKSKLVVCPNKFFMRFVFLACFFIFFIGFLSLEILYFFSYIFFIKIFSKFTKNFKVRFKNFNYFFSKFSFFLRLFFLFVLKPILYCGYIVAVLLFCVLYMLKDLVLLVYVLFARCLHRFWIMCFINGNTIKRFYRITPTNFKYFMFYPYIKISRIVFFIYKFWKRFTTYSFFTKFGSKIVIFVGSICLVYSTFYFLFSNPNFWAFIMLIYNWIFFKCYFFFYPFFVVYLFILVICFIFPFTRRFIQMHKYTLLAIRGARSYADSKFIQQFNLVFYSEISREPSSFRLSRWGLRGEVNDLKRIMDHELVVKKNVYAKDQRYNVKLALKKKFNSRSDKLYHLAKLISRSIGVLSSREFDSSFTKKSSTFSEIERLVKSIGKFRYDPLEFKLYQRGLSQFYFILSNESLGIGSSIYRSIYYYKNRKAGFLHRFKNKNSVGSFQRRQGVSRQIPGFLFESFDKDLYSARVFNFFELALDYYYYISRPAIFLHSRGQYKFNRRVDLDPINFISRIFNDESRVSWNYGLKPSRNQYLWNYSGNFGTTFGIRGTLKSLSWFNFPSVIDDLEFQAKLDHEVADNTFNYRSTSTYLQKFRDIDWVVRLNSNIFLSYSFVSDFSTSGIFPFWIFKNFFLGLLDYPTYQENFSSWINHFIFSGVYSYNYNYTNNFFEYLSDFNYKNFNYYYTVLYHFNVLTEEVGAEIDINNRREGFSTGMRYWNFELRNATSYMRSLLSSEIANYLYTEIDAIDTRGYKLLCELDMNYTSQSSHISQLRTITSTGMQRYIFTEKEKEKGSIWFDLVNLLRALLITDTSDDKKFAKFKGVKITRDGKDLDLERFSKIENDRLESVKLGYWTFPSIRPTVVFQFIGICITNIHLCAHPYMGTYESYEFWLFINKVVLFLFNT